MRIIFLVDSLLKLRVTFMKRKILFAASFFTALNFFCAAASAYPEFEIEPHPDGGGIIIVTNPDPRAWNCSVHWEVVGDEFGELKTEPRGGNFGVGVGWKHAIVLNAGGVALTNIHPFEIPSPSCH
jgi:hypothetical protein